MCSENGECTDRCVDCVEDTAGVSKNRENATV